MYEVGQRYGKLIILEKFKKENNKHFYLKCQCDCGNIVIKRTDAINENSSCGCYTSELLSLHIQKHGLCKHRINNIYKAMMARCYNSKKPFYKHYGGRGIIVCDEWKKGLVYFAKWAFENGYKEGLSIDRIDNNGNYEPNNCRWITMKEQQRNKRTNVNITYNNETHCVSEWAEILDFNLATLQRRIYTYHWTVERAFTTPVRKVKNKTR